MKITNNGSRPISKLGVTIGVGETVIVEDERAAAYFLSRDCVEEMPRKATKKAPAPKE